MIPSIGSKWWQVSNGSSRYQRVQNVPSVKERAPISINYKLLDVSPQQHPSNVDVINSASTSHHTLAAGEAQDHHGRIRWSVHQPREKILAVLAHWLAAVGVEVNQHGVNVQTRVGRNVGSTARNDDVGNNVLDFTVLRELQKGVRKKGVRKMKSREKESLYKQRKNLPPPPP